ncbi:hypothetical protein [Enterocloster asparagiformis]|uniref:hypothetical protein n=1 Tax=Enterocloster asparagiformis TaxID=333367 RepID=UPI002A8299DE|nr:hypothetical protein [Enterocloster asparagiformis]
MTNYAAIGYALMAADEMRMSSEDKERLALLMICLMDEKPEEKAETRYRDE